MYFNIAICDDDPTDAAAVEDCLLSYAKKSGSRCDIKVFTDAGVLHKAYDRPNTYDILFLDVEMPEEDGLQLAASIRSLPDYDVKIVFISNYPSHMQKSFDVQAHHFLEKPVAQEELNKVMDQILAERRSRMDRRIHITDNNGDHFIHPEELYYVSVDSTSHRDLLFFLKDNTICTRASLRDYESRLQSLGFVYIYRNTLINLMHLHSIEKNSVLLDNDTRLPLSRRYERELRNDFVRYSVTTIHSIQNDSLTH